ncbi:MAG: hypothetical protein S0880_33290 [Actinomycetota bacterium]|nr:hypothetical protein [Actinomycetota bacterium]
MEHAVSVYAHAPTGDFSPGKLSWRDDGGATAEVESNFAVVAGDAIRLSWEDGAEVIRAYAAVRDVVQHNGSQTLTLGRAVFERGDRRRVERVDVFCEARLAWMGGDGPRALAARTQNISVLGGSFVTDSMELPPNGATVATHVADADYVVVAGPATVIDVERSGEYPVLRLEWRLDARQEASMVEYLTSLRHLRRRGEETPQTRGIAYGDASCWLVEDEGVIGPLKASVKITGVTLTDIDPIDVPARGRWAAILVDSAGQTSTVSLRIVSRAGGQVHTSVG